MFSFLWNYWDVKKGPLTFEATQRWKSTDPAEKLTRFRVLHCLPTFLTTFLKLDHLRAMGAEIVCTESQFVDSDPAAQRLYYPQTEFKCIPFEEAIELAKREPFDIVLDTGGELAGRVRPRIGTVELTQTGEVRYRALGDALDFPVISVDSSKLKRIEDALGSADGFMRAIRALTSIDSESNNAKRVVVVGYGKVGVGICMQLRAVATVKEIIVVEVNESALQRARAEGLTAVHWNDFRRTVLPAPNLFMVVTCTGVDGLMSKEFKESDFAEDVVFANMGVHDEFGPAFRPERCLYRKQAVNFALEEPTLFAFLDPAFAASQEAIPYLYKLGPGVHPLPSDLDERILADWEKAHGRKLNLEKFMV